MALVMPRSMQASTLSLILSEEDLKLRLYQNNVTPSETSAVGDFTEATFTGYSEATLQSANWTITQGNPTEAVYDAPLPFVSSAGSQNQQIYGYYVVGAVSGDLKWAERFPSLPGPIVNDQDTIAITPRITLDNETA